ncbi:unnamed protein product [Allacma fusca]|uniref:Uncharacterized protein n=1 Tax=Allacma fusca TaxID=39272 RepID=A0A8J2P7L7_9HEXA|nr:unnamed protein product [Allacma fusca]
MIFISLSTKTGIHSIFDRVNLIGKGMALTSAWRRKPTCKLVSILDAVFALLMVALHSYILSSADRRPIELLRGLFDIDKHWSVYVLLWVTIYLVNIAQVVVAYLLYCSIKPDYPEPHLIQSRAQRWLKFSSAVFILLILKFVLFIIYFVKNYIVDELSLMACLADIIWKDFLPRRRNQTLKRAQRMTSGVNLTSRPRHEVLSYVNWCIIHNAP